MEFLDFMVAKGYGTSSSIDPWKSASKQVFSTVEGEGFESFDVRSFDVDEYLTRFENMSIGKYSAESLRAYRGRFRKAVDAYRSYLADPNWRPPPPRRSTRSAPEGSEAKGQGKKRGSAKGSDLVAAAPPASPLSDSLIAYPFPLKSGQMARLHLPTQLDREDAERLTHFIRALVFEQPVQIGTGDPEAAS